METEDVTAGAAVFAHPLRVEIVRALAAGRRSPSELAAEFELPIGNVSYHVRQLAKLHVIADAGTRPVRGAVEHFYRLNGGMDAVKALRAATGELLTATTTKAGVDRWDS